MGLAHMRLPCGAGHDAVYGPPAEPIGMVFIPLLNGSSHCAEESINSLPLRMPWQWAGWYGFSSR